MASIEMRIAALEAVKQGREAVRPLMDYRQWNEPLLGLPGDQVVYRIGETSHHPAHVVKRLPGEDDRSYWIRAEEIALTAPGKPGLAPLPLVEAYHPPDLGDDLDDGAGVDVADVIEATAAVTQRYQPRVEYDYHEQQLRGLGQGGIRVSNF